MLEKEIEKLFKREVEKRGWLTFKFNSGVVGVPDRIVIVRGLIYFVELKTNTGKLSQVQILQIAKMRKNGARVEVVKGKVGVKAFIENVALTMMVYGVQTP